MNKLKIKKAKEKKLIWIKLRYYIDFIILVCCSIIAFNISPSNNEKNNNTYSNKQVMTYIFHDYAWNEYIMNDKIHGAPSSWNYLFDNEIPDDLKWNEIEFVDYAPLEDSDWNLYQNNTGWIKDNQISFDDVINDLWAENLDDQNTDSDILIITIGWDSEETSNKNDNNYIVKEENQSGNAISLIIERIDDNNINNDSLDIENTITTENNNNSRDSNDDELLTAKAFTFTKEWRILPILVSRTDLYFDENPIGYSNWETTSDKDGPTIIPNYADCMTPWWYKIRHWESVLAYKQMYNAPDICNIERRFCWKWKLSGTYTQQWCSINKNYTYEQRWNIKETDSSDEFKWNTKQNSDGSVTVKKHESLASSIFNAPNNTYSDFSKTDNIRVEEPWIEQTNRPHPGCTTPRWEKVNHWDFVQAFKHANWFSDAPCEAQIRLCSVWELMWTYKESTCKTRDTSFIDWINGSPSRETYSKEKIERVKKQIKNEETYYENTRKNAERSTNSDVLDRILYILDQD